jgi:RNA polymerase sigma factor (sigma-70 family)
MARPADQDVPHRADPLLEPLVRAKTEEEKRTAIERILERAEPIIRRVLFRKIRSGDEEAAEIHSEVVLGLIARLQHIGADDAEPIASIDNYTASVTLHAFHNVMRLRYPQRARLKNRIRYLLTHDARFTMWPTRSHDTACGFARWKRSGRAEDAEALLESRDVPVAARDPRHPAEVLTIVFEQAGHPLELESLVNFLALLWDIREQVEFEPNANAVENECDPAAVSASTMMEAHEFVLWLWNEIAALNARQRAAILWHLRDAKGQSALPLILISGAATLEQIADALSTSPSELLGVWYELPFDDRRIASMLGITRQQVINLRKSARERLSRRMKHFQ